MRRLLQVPTLRKPSGSADPEQEGQTQPLLSFWSKRTNNKAIISLLKKKRTALNIHKDIRECRETLIICRLYRVIVILKRYHVGTQ